MHKIRQKRIKNDGFVLLIVIFLILFLSIFLGSIILRTTTQMTEAKMRLASEQAYDAAESGLAFVQAHLQVDPRWQPHYAYGQSKWHKLQSAQGENNGFFELDMQPVHTHAYPVKRRIQIIGYDASKRIQRTLTADLLIKPVQQFLVQTAGALFLSSGTLVDAPVVARSIVFDTLTDPSEKQKNIIVSGDLYYSDSIKNQQHPSVIMNAKLSQQKITDYAFPGIDAHYYAQLAKQMEDDGLGLYHEGDLTVNLDNLLGLRPEAVSVPKIIFATGNVRIQGKYADSCLIIALGNIFCTGDIVARKEAGLHPQLALWSYGDVVISNTDSPDILIEAFLLADGRAADSHGVIRTVGGPLSRKNFYLFGAMAARGTKDKKGSAIDLSAYENRELRFNQDLSLAPNIPFLPYAVYTLSRSSD